MRLIRNNFARRGSVLILVVVLVVLLALMGTAMLMTTRNDRYVVTQNTANTQVDLLVEGVREMARSAILSDLNDNAKTPPYRPPGYLEGTTTYDHWDAPDVNTGMTGGTFPNQNDKWLSLRLPSLTNESQPASPANPPYWLAIAPPLDGAGSFDSPFASSTQTGPVNLSLATTYTDRLGLRPTWVQPPGFAQPLPAWALSAPARYVLAGDADGDGIADSGLFKLPVGEIDGITYYAAVRIIDNNSAINVNTALCSRADFNGAGTVTINSGFFRTSVGLAEMLRSYNPASAAWMVGSGTLAAQAELALLVNHLDSGVPPADVQGSPSVRDPFVDDPSTGSLATNSRFTFDTIGDALEHQLIRRLDNPGAHNSASGTAVYYRPFSLTDQVSLAWHFTLANLDTSPTQLETALDETLYSGAANRRANSTVDPISGAATTPMYIHTQNPVLNRTSYQANQVVWWYSDNFDFVREISTAASSVITTFRPKRALMVTHNPVSNLIPRHGMGEQNVNTPVPTSCKTVDPQANPNLMPNYDGDGTPAHPRYVPAKTNINTATFGELWRAFWCVMDEEPSPGTHQIPSKDKDGNAYSPMLDKRMFRPEAMRNTAITGWSAYHQLLLRAAIAAVNAISLRNGDLHGVVYTTSNRPIVSKRITLSDRQIEVFGISRQPYITEVLLERNSSGEDFLAVEFYNPYPNAATDDFDLNNWTLAIIDRSVSPWLITSIRTFGAGDRIPAGQYLVVWDGTGAYSATPPVPLPAGAINVAGLVGALDKELVLLRPRRADGALTVIPGQIDESNLVDLVPVDQIDLVGLTRPGTGADRYHYARSTGPWEFVYPGNYDPVAPIPTKSFQPAPGATGNFGAGNPATGVYFTIQLANVDWAGPNPVPPGAPSPPYRYPFGGFARNGDILQVPFIGGYSVFNATHQLLVMNSVTMDATFAEDKNITAATAGECELGRFCPRPDTAHNNANYDWAADLFDYLTVQAPSDDYAPGEPGLTADSKLSRKAVRNTLDFAAADSTSTSARSEDTVPLHGLVNINTAPWRVLAALPWVPAGDKYSINITTGAVFIGTDNSEDNQQLARAITYWRDVNDGTGKPGGPFRSIFDLYHVPAVRNLNTQFVSADPDDAQGDFSPAGTGVDGVRNDFEEKYLLLNRVSNLITTRSDSFTVYVLVQGWRGVGTNSPELVVQRRVAFIQDRSPVTLNNTRLPAAVNVPND